MSTSGACALRRSRPATTTHVAGGPEKELERLLELVKLLERGGAEPRRLAGALRSTRAAARLFAADVDGFKAALDLLVRQLWPGDDVPFELAWALQAVGLEVPARAAS